jgi:uncharacterized protein (DUF488 family)
MAEPWARISWSPLQDLWHHISAVKPQLFTIGHSTHSWEHFLELLQLHNIAALADVRSTPFSARFPHFSKPVLEMRLRTAHIHYVPMGEALGARRSERECYIDGVARYDLIAQTPAFLGGLQRLRAGSEKLRLALFCAEKDPLECHRTILVCRHVRNTFNIQHVLADGALESHEDAERRLMREEGVPPTDLFTSALTLLQEAYDRRAQKIAYRESTEPMHKT